MFTMRKNSAPNRFIQATFSKKLQLLRGHIPPQTPPCVAQARQLLLTRHCWLQKIWSPPLWNRSAAYVMFTCVLLFLRVDIVFISINDTRLCHEVSVMFTWGLIFLRVDSVLIRINDTKLYHKVRVVFTWALLFLRAKTFVMTQGFTINWVWCSHELCYS